MNSVCVGGGGAGLHAGFAAGAQGGGEVARSYEKDHGM